MSVQSVDLKSTNIKADRMQRRPDDASAAPPSPDSQATRSISRDTLTNRLNYLHFQTAPLTAVLLHRRNRRSLRLGAEIVALEDDRLSCCWRESLTEPLQRGDFELHHLEIPQGHHILQVEPDQVELDDSGFCCSLPETCRQLTSRRIRRHDCTAIEVSVIQNGAAFNGTLIDYSAAAFRLELTAQPPQTFHWLNDAEPLTVLFAKDGQTLLSVPGKLQRSQGQRQTHSVVIAATAAPLRRFPPKQHRGRRLSLSPAPEAVFTHPITGNLVHLDVVDLSGAGMALTEPAQEALLLPGMIIDDLELRLADSFSLPCKAQVVYCLSQGDDDEEPLRCGLAILDMAVPDHTRLMALLHRAEHRSKGICPKIDLDQLWEFFFSSGFIYPQKYQSLKGYRDSFKETFARLYDTAPKIARHFTCQEKGRIVGHLAMLRQFSNAWLIQHHAADRTHSRTAGLEVLQLVGEAVNEAQALYSSHMDYVMCFFRPENRFPQRVFGGVASHYDDPQSCSVDTFDYFHYRKEYELAWRKGSEWALQAITQEDLLDLDAFYQGRSGGLMLQAMDLAPQAETDAELNDSYAEAGFQRARTLYALQRSGVTVAVLMALRTEAGLNLSSLTDAITVIVLDNKALPREAFLTALATLAATYPHDQVPVLSYPHGYADSQSIEVEKQYNLWTLDCRRLDPYFDFCANYFKRINRDKKESDS
jgi:hypothetical protein